MLLTTAGRPVAEVSEHQLEPLRHGAEFTLYRGRERGDQTPILAVAVTGDQPSPQSLRRLEHEHSLATDLDPAWAAQPLALTRRQGRAILILRDPGGDPLDQIIERNEGRPMDPTRLLPIAIDLAAALGQVHRAGLIHKDIKPANVLVGEAGRVWLTGFGVASQLLRERQAPAPPEIIDGTLAYMSPEQTGRMNRSVDARSDLYALGVTFYEMLTGVLPFAAADPLEWIHCHIARQPIAPADRCAAPEALSAIIMRLLAKNAEERYQTAAGLEADLRRCLSQWRSDDRIDPFPLGAADVSDRLLISEKLYGREREVDALLAAFDRVAARGAVELVLVSGYSGVGKSSVVNELHKVLAPPSGLFAAGKFDQYKRDIPYATLAQAFQSLVRQVLSKSDAELQDWRDAVGEALGANGRLIIGLIPELELVVGPQPPVAELAPQDAQRRFQAVLRRFIGVFARPEHPLALFLDDLQWLDAATLDLLGDLLTQGDIRHLLLIGAYRDNEIDAAHPLMRKLGAIRAAGASVHDIVLAPLGYEHIEQLITDAVRCGSTVASPLVRLVHEKTGGNPFFAVQFLQALAEEGLLVFDHGEGQWFCDLRRIGAKRYTDNVVDLMVGKLRRLPTQTVAALRQLACIGASADFALLTTVGQAPLEELHVSFREAVRAGLVLRSEFSYAFQHDRIQEAAYSLIPEHARAEAHLRIGRLLLAQTPPEGLDEVIFEIVNQFNRGTTLLTSQEEREQVARLNLAAGKRAKNAAAYSSALTYFAEGRTLLLEDCWRLQYPLAFAVELNLAECEFLTRELASAEERLAMLARSAANPVDQAAVTCLRADLFIILARPERSVAVCLDYLRQVGFEVSPHPTDEAVQQEYERLWRRLGVRPIEDLIDLPLMEDVGASATMDVLAKVTPYAQTTDQNLNRVLLAYMVNLSIEHGASAAACLGYALMGRVLAEDGRYPTAGRFGQLSLDLVDERGLDAFRARVCLQFGTGISPFLQHLRFARTLLLRTFEEAVKIGDLVYVGYCRAHLITNSTVLGRPLHEVEQEAMDGIGFARKTGSGFLDALIVGHLWLIRTLRGLPYDFGSSDDEAFDEDNFRRRLDADPNLSLAASGYWLRRLQACAFMNDHAAALEASAKARVFPWIFPPVVEVADYHLHTALACAGLSDTADAVERGMHLEALATHNQQLQAWAEQCPENFENRAALVAAEIARIEGRELDAARRYQQAIRSARENGFIHNEALACETAARFYAARGFEDIAEMYLLRARDGYRRWGADGVVRRLEARYPWLAGFDPRGETNEGPPADQQVDVAAVVKASQALSSEMLLPRLIERLMTITLQDAGAERGLLILIREGELRIEAEATTELGEIKLTVRQAVITPSDLPQSVLHYALRTQERVLLDDASSGDAYSADTYVRAKRSRSILCLPIIRHGELVGALYLENSLVPGAFTPERVTVLELLASQAAISLENAALYTDLELQVGLLQQLPVSAWTLRPDGTPDFVNQGWLDFTGQTLDFVRSRPEAWMIAVHPDDRDMAAKSFWQGVHSGQGFAFETRTLRARDGTYRWHLQQAVVLRDAEGKVLKFVGTTTDIDDQKRAEEALRRRTASLVQGQHLAKLGGFVWFPEEDELVVSEELRLIWGYEPGETATLPNIWERMLPEYRVPLGEQLELARKGIPTDSLFQMRMPDGSTKHMSSITRGARTPDGRLEMIGTVQDVTESKLAEEALTRARSELAHVARVATLNAMTASIAHEVSQPLSGILTNANTSLKMLAADPPNLAGAAETARRTIRDANRATDVIKRLRAMFSNKAPVMERVDLNDAAREVIALSAGELQRNRALLLTDFADDLPFVSADRVQLQQVILNLLLNAADAMAEVQDRPRRIQINTGLHDDGSVKLEVRDSGTGLESEAVEKLFEAFYTTKPNGMGIGLSICRSIIENHDGRLWAMANDGPGATFSFTIPSASLDRIVRSKIDLAAPG